jgi:mono/diheme cytochrome c family protein
MKKRILLLLGVIMLLASCSQTENSAGYEYMPDMYQSPSIEAYEEAMLTTPVNSQDLLAYNQEFEEPNLDEGKRLYQINCAVCHGKLGLGDGPVVEKGGHARPPAYNNLELNYIQDIIYTGKGMMGSYASMLNKKERNLVANYVYELQLE